jgi:hypothetical protein
MKDSHPSQAIKTARKPRGRLAIQFTALLLMILSPFLLYIGLENDLTGLAQASFGLLLLGMGLTLWAA